MSSPITLPQSLIKLLGNLPEESTKDCDWQIYDFLNKTPASQDLSSPSLCVWLPAP